jgi:DNA-binding response OmpR family regulator
MTYESVVFIESQIAPGVTYEVQKMSYGRRAELMRRIRELARKQEFQQASQNASDKMDAALLEADVNRVYVTWGLRSIAGLTLDGVEATPEILAGLVKKHWRIVSHHWVRDVVYREDHQHAYTGTSAHLMATLRNLALALPRLAGITQLTRTIQRINADRTRILPLLAATTSTNRL